LFAPNDAAFAKLPSGVLDYLLANPKALTDILLYHVVAGNVYSKDIPARTQFVATLLPNKNVSVRQCTIWQAMVSGFRRGVRVNGAPVAQADIQASNGVIHVIDQVLIPPDFVVPMDLIDTAAQAGLSTLVKAVIRADLVGALRTPNRTFTVFAPTDAAFAKLPPGVVEFLLRDKNKGSLQEVLKYHVVPGTINAGAILNRTVTTAQTLAVNKTLSFAVNNNTVSINAGAARVVQPNVFATNGVAHVIDQVLVPPGVTLPPNIVDLAKSLPDQFSTLTTALQAAGLDKALVGAGPFTVFAPTNAAFAALPSGTLNSLLADPNGQLTNVLQYHVIAGEVPAAEAIRLAGSGASIRMLNGQAVRLSLVNRTKLTLNGASTVVTPDVYALNGVVHVIDKVLIPAAR